MSAEGGTRAIVAALLANLGIAVTKFVAFLVSGSSSMLAESVHSLADSGNQVLLLVGGRRAARTATPQHPFGYGRERYVYAFVVSIVLFSRRWRVLGLRGRAQDPAPRGAHQPRRADRACCSSRSCLESFSLRTAVVESNKVRGGQSWVQFVRRAKAPELPVVLLEDLAALVGLVLALVAVSASRCITGDARVGRHRHDRHRRAARGDRADPRRSRPRACWSARAGRLRTSTAIQAAIAGAATAIDRVIHLKTLYLGPDELLVAAKVAVADRDRAAGDGRARSTRPRSGSAQAVPVARVIYLEPDLYDAARAAVTLQQA